MLLLACALALAASPEVPDGGPVAAEAGAEASGRLARVEVTGLRRVEEAAIVEAARLQVGDLLRPDTVRSAVRAVWQTGFVDDVVVRLSGPPDARVLTMQVREKPAVREVGIAGNKKVKSEDLDDKVDIEPFTVPSETRIRANVKALRDAYLEKGFYLVEVTPERTAVGDDLVDLTFRIVENRKVLVREVDIVGNTEVPDRAFRGFMQTRAAGAIPWLSSGGTFVEQNLENDTYVLRSVLLEQGYVDANVGEPRAFLTPDKRFINVSIPVEEGPRYRVGALRVEGDFVPEEGLTRGAVEALLSGASVRDVEEAFARDQRAGVPITADWRPKLPSGVLAVRAGGPPVREGDWFKLSVLQAAMQRVSDLYGDRGYAFANATPVPATDAKRGVVDVTVDVQRGERVRIGRIDITGNDPTWDKVIRREIPLNEGDVYRTADVRDARARLERLGFFEKVSIDTPRGSAPDVLDMKVDVTERPTGSFSVGAGYGSADSFLFTANIQKSNFLGLGYIMSLAGNFSARTKQGNLSFYDPHFLDTQWTFKIDGFTNTRTYIENEYQRGGTLQVGRYLDARDDVRLAVDYTLEDVGLLSLDEYKERLLGGQLYRNGITSSLGATFEVDKRNNRINATRGVRFSLSTELAGGVRVDSERVLSLLGGDFNFWQTQANLRFYRPLVTKDEVDWLVFKVNSSVGHIQSTDGSIVPYIHRYRAGGILSVRGYDPFSLGPSIRGMGYRDTRVTRSQFVGTDDPAAADDRLVVGGTETWVNNVELESPILKSAGISVVAFFDAGNTFGDPWGEGAFDPTGLRLSAGAGVRWISPIGPLRFEWGVPLGRYPDERSSVFDFTIGSAF
jgi:outer membrane protein insertion porin family